MYFEIAQLVELMYFARYKIAIKPNGKPGINEFHSAIINRSNHVLNLGFMSIADIC